MTFEHRLTIGHVARHTPPGSTISRSVALLDIAQDFLLSYLHAHDAFELVVFKGGTALRKFFAGAAGRFSTDLDFAIASATDDRSTVADVIAGLLDAATVGPFRFATMQRRGRWEVSVTTELGDIPIPMKLDVGPPCWLTPVPLQFVPTPIHRTYEFDLPNVPTVRLEENLAEKIARLNRVSAARDASDLVWAATTSPHSQFDRAMQRRLAMLKVWADVNGLDGHWQSAPAARPFAADRWLSVGRDWDDDSIGLLAHPPPPIRKLEADLVRLYGHLRELSPEEVAFAAALEVDRTHVVTAIAELPDSQLSTEVLWSK